MRLSNSPSGVLHGLVLAGLLSRLNAIMRAVRASCSIVLNINYFPGLSTFFRLAVDNHVGHHYIDIDSQTEGTAPMTNEIKAKSAWNAMVAHAVKRQAEKPQTSDYRIQVYDLPK